MTSIPLRFAALLLLLALPTFVHGQDEAGDEVKTDVQIAGAGVRRYEPGTWSTMAINGTNKSKVDANEFVSIYVGEDNEHLQFARRFWLPAGTRRQTFVPIFIPKTSPDNPNQTGAAMPQLDAFMIRVKEKDGGETFRVDSTAVNKPNHPLQMDYMQTKSGLLFHREMPGENEAWRDADWDAYEAAYKARESAVSSRVMIEFTGDFIPPFPTTLDSLDQMIISGDRILNDSVGLAYLRHWLQRGGRIWIMLDTTSMETVTALLGNAARCSVFDRVELNEFEIEDLGDAQRPSDKPVVESWSAETPVTMVRVFAGTDDVHCRIDGWPAAFWQKVGDGEVLFTTLGPRGWVVTGSPTPALASVARRFYQPSEEVTVDPVAIGAMLNDQIGYRIPSRRLAAWILGLNSLAILSFGGWWAWQRRLERLAWFVPVVALFAAASFLVIGSRNTAVVPSTVATGQIARVSKATNESYVSAVSAIYSQTSGPLDVIAKNGALATTKAMESRGTDKRIVWDDDGKSWWTNLQQPSGVIRYIESKRTVSDSTPRVAHGTFDETGFNGTLTGIDATDCEDAVIIAVPARASAVSLDATGSFRVGTRDVLANGQYIADALMSDKQRSRQQLLRELLASTALNPFGAEPSLLVWTPPLDMGVEFASTFEQLGSALMSIPLEIARPAPGTDVHIPATFIRTLSFSGRQGASSVFNQRTGEWLQDATKPTRSQLRFVFPEALLPLQLKQATVTIKINAPSRIFRIEGIVDGQPTVLYERADRSGILRIAIDRPEALELDADGGLHLAIVVTETDAVRAVRDGQTASPTAQNENSTWQIDYVQVDAVGTTR